MAPQISKQYKYYNITLDIVFLSEEFPQTCWPNKYYLVHLTHNDTDIQ